jgi:hypothetical protein
LNIECQFPGSITDTTSPCPGTPAIVDILKVVTGIAVYAVDSLLMPRPRRWNYKAVYLATEGDCTWTVAKRPDCALCGERSTTPQSGFLVIDETPTPSSPDPLGVLSGQACLPAGKAEEGRV